MKMKSQQFYQFFFEGKTITPKVEQCRYFVSHDFFCNIKVGVIGNDILIIDLTFKNEMDNSDFYKQ